MAASSSEGPSAFDSPMYSRTAGRDVFGKYDGSLPEIRVPFAVEQDVRRAAHEDGCADVTGWLRALVMKRLYGAKSLASLHEAQYERIGGNAGQDEKVYPLPTESLPPYLRSASK